MTQAKDISIFCERSEDTWAGSRGACRPWIKDGWRYATDGTIIAREMAKGKPQGALPAVSSHVKESWWEWSEQIPITLSRPERTACRACDGTGKRPDRCPRCWWDGSLYYSEDSEHVCPRCDGTGRSGPSFVDCDDCGGEGGTLGYRHREGDLTIDPKYAEILHTLGAEVWSALVPALSPDTRFLVFRAGEIAGVLMPMKDSA